MPDLPSPLSWSVISAGWADTWLDIPTVRALAEEQLLTASGYRLILLSDLVGASDQISRADVGDVLRQLAYLENWPPFLALREWQVLRVRWSMEHLPNGVDEEEPWLDQTYQEWELRTLWAEIGEPLDLPLLSPFFSPALGVHEGISGWPLTLLLIKQWLEQQDELLTAAHALHDAGHHQALHVMARAFEQTHEHAAARLSALNAEHALLESFLDRTRESEFTERVKQFNAERHQQRQAQLTRMQTKNSQSTSGAEQNNDLER